MRIRLTGGPFHNQEVAREEIPQGAQYHAQGIGNGFIALYEQRERSGEFVFTGFAQVAHDGIVPLSTSFTTRPVQTVKQYRIKVIGTDTHGNELELTMSASDFEEASAKARVLGVIPRATCFAPGPDSLSLK